MAQTKTATSIANPEIQAIDRSSPEAVLVYSTIERQAAKSRIRKVKSLRAYQSN